MVCNGEYDLSGTHFRCHGTHGKINLLQAIQHSCDVYFWKLAERVGLDRIADVARDYGLGAPTNLGLNGDSAGRIPTKSWYEQKSGHYKVGYATNAAIGQGDVEVTVLQMAMAYAAIANSGTLYVPQIVERVESNDGHLIASYDPKVAHTVKTPADALETWKKGMYKVTNELGGTAYLHGHIEGLTVMGKTGTAEVKKHHQPDDEKDLDRLEPERGARVVRRLGARRRSRDRDRRDRRARRRRRRRRVADREADPRGLLHEDPSERRDAARHPPDAHARRLRPGRERPRPAAAARDRRHLALAPVPRRRRLAVDPRRCSRCARSAC